MNAVIHDYVRPVQTANLTLIREYTETGRIEAMARTLDDIRALPETARKETP